MTFDLDPDARNVVAFVAYDENGRITMSGKEGLYFVRQRHARGERVLIVNEYVLYSEADAGFYVKEGDGARMLPRPVLDPKADTWEPQTMKEAVVSGLPAGKATFTGPRSGTQDHKGGQMKIGWATPGTYTVTFEAWPHKPTVMTFTVKSRLAL